MKKTLCLVSAFCFQQILLADQWVQKAYYGGTPRNGNCIFSIGNKGYIGIGTDSYPVYNFKSDFWEYDVAMDSWTQKANFPGTARYTPISFSIGTKGYVGTGWNQVSPFFNDMWQYNQVTNTWVQKANFPGPLRQGGIGFVIGNKAYAGFGNDNSNTFKDFYAYNDTTDVWTPVAVFPGASRFHAFYFALNGKGYIGAGSVGYPNYNFVNDMWEYNPATNSWAQKANFPGLPRFQLGFFSINDIGYAGMGEDVINGSVTNCYNDFYAYNPITNTWTAKSNYPVAAGAGIQGGFTISGKGYTGCGYNVQTGNLNSFYEYVPDTTTGINDEEVSANDYYVYPNPCLDFINISCNKSVEKKNARILITDAAGKNVYTSNFITQKIKVDVSDFAKGIYIVQLSNGNNMGSKQFVKQ
jgi:N-acetylneuraminic acid mutarotase